MLKTITGAVGAPTLFLGTAAHAALPTEVTTAITEYKTDTLEAIGIVIGAGVVIWGLLKLASKLGWR